MRKNLLKQALPLCNLGIGSFLPWLTFDPPTDVDWASGVASKLRSKMLPLKGAAPFEPAVDGTSRTKEGRGGASWHRAVAACSQEASLCFFLSVLAKT